MSICPRSGAMALEQLICFKYYIVLNGKVPRFTFGLNAAKKNALDRRKLKIKVVRYGCERDVGSVRLYYDTFSYHKLSQRVTVSCRTTC